MMFRGTAGIGRTLGKEWKFLEVLFEIILGVVFGKGYKMDAFHGAGFGVICFIASPCRAKYLLDT